VEIVVLVPVSENTLREIKELIELLGSPPIDVIIVGESATKLEVGDINILKVALPLDKYKILREVAFARAVTEPELLEVWAVPQELAGDNLAYELSLALLNRLLDVLIAKADYSLVREKASVEVVEGETVAHTLIRTLAVDVSVSLAVAGYTSEASQLVAKMADHPIYNSYKRFWEFVVSNFKFMPIYNWLLLFYGQSTSPSSVMRKDTSPSG